MSNIETQIKLLLQKKKKIDYLKYIYDLIRNDTKCVDFKEVQPEIIKKIEPFITELKASIESDTEVVINPKSVFSEKQSEALLELADKYIIAKNKPKVEAPKNESFSKEENKSVVVTKKSDREYSVSDKMNFAISNRHLGGKKVQVENDTNSVVTGTVVGLDAPFVIVQTDQGPRIQVPPEKVMMV